jgi:hypothetical protein
MDHKAKRNDVIVYSSRSVVASLMAMTFTGAKSSSRPKSDHNVGCETTTKGTSVVVLQRGLGGV